MISAKENKRKKQLKIQSLCTRVTYRTFIPACFASSSAEHGCWILMKLSKIPALYPNPNTRVLIPSLTICSKSLGSSWSDAIEQKLTPWRSRTLFFHSMEAFKSLNFMFVFFYFVFFPFFCLVWFSSVIFWFWHAT